MPFDRALVGKPSEPSVLSYSWKDAALYALGVGARRDELDYLYEGRGPKVLPTFAAVLTLPATIEVLMRCGGDPAMVVHSAERVTLHAPFAPSGRLSTTATIRDYYDMRRFAQVLVDTRVVDEGGRLVAEATSTMLYRDAGGFGGPSAPKEPAPVERPRDVPPTFAIEEATSPEQALLYRLSGDPNPLHADPAFAKSVGFEQGPILHGMCTFGFMARHAARAVCGGDAARIRGLEAQFKRPVWPGETLVTEGWVVRPGAVALRVRVKERDEVVISGAWATYEA